MTSTYIDTQGRTPHQKTLELGAMAGGIGGKESDKVGNAFDRHIRSLILHSSRWNGAARWDFEAHLESGQCPDRVDRENGLNDVRTCRNDPLGEGAGS